MKNYTDETIISKEEGDKIVRLKNWESIGETTNGYIYWNNKTGELLYEGPGDNYQIVRKKKIGRIKKEHGAAKLLDCYRGLTLTAAQKS